MNNGIYIYGIINSGTRELKGAGWNADAPVYLVPYQDVAAIVSDEEIVDLSHLPKDLLARRLVDHQRVIEGVMSLKHTIIPMKLGTFAGNPSEVQEILARGYKTVAEVFHTVCDKLEFDVVVTWPDLASVLKAIGEEPDIREAKQKLLVNPRKITVEDQMRVGLMVKKALDAHREQIDLKIRSVLSAISPGVRVHELMDDRMITNTAFLIERDRQAEFEQCLDRLNTETGEKLYFRCVGPLPPYSFCTLE
ncbi:MAG: GvpL/GvpF family gas vesicle protein, partial [Lentisphaerota bacterium]